MNIFTKIRKVFNLLKNIDSKEPDYMPVSVGGVTLYRCCRSPNIFDYPFHGLTCRNCGAKVYGHTATERATLWNEAIKKAKGYQ
jgi:hypothetical protein